MERSKHDREVVLPAEALAALRDAVVGQAGESAANAALKAAGIAAGERLFEETEAELGRSLGEIGEETFWRQLSSNLARRGWGTLRHEAPHPGVGLLTGTGWVDGPDQGSPFSEGMIQGVLSRAAGKEVSVIRVPAEGSDVDPAFAFGSAAAIRWLRSRIRDQGDVRSALEMP